MWDPAKHITVSDSCCTLTNWHLMIPNWSKVNVKARCPSSAGRRSASEKDGGALKKYLYKDVFQSAEWADPHIQHSTRAVRICLTNRDGRLQTALRRPLRHWRMTKTFLIFVEQLLSVFRGQITGEGCAEVWADANTKQNTQRSFKKMHLIALISF